MFLKIWQKIAPRWIISYLRFHLEPSSLKQKRKAVLNFYKNTEELNLSKEIKEGLEFLRNHKYTPLPYKWTLEYENLVPEIFLDHGIRHYYIIFQNKRLYFPANFTRNQVIWGTRSIFKEQDPRSPHIYLTKDFDIEPNSIVIDAGVAEGNFALSVVEKAKKLYLIECEAMWVEALKLTFEPWKEKVIIIEKYLTGNDSENTVKIDSIITPQPNEKYHIKMDIEGYEKDALKGMTRFLTDVNNLSMNICTYHFPDDLKEISLIMEKHRFHYEVSDGYLLYFNEGEVPFRKALIRARKPIQS